VPVVANLSMARGHSEWKDAQHVIPAEAGIQSVPVIASLSMARGRSEWKDAQHVIPAEAGIQSVPVVANLSIARGHSEWKDAQHVIPAEAGIQSLAAKRDGAHRSGSGPAVFAGMTHRGGAGEKSTREPLVRGSSSLALLSAWPVRCH
jgi:hypothetical protein